MFVGTQVDTISCKGVDSVCCPLSCVFSSVFIILIGAVIGLTYYSITDRKERVPTEGYSQTAIITETSGDTQRFGEDEENRSNESSPDEDRAAIEEKEDRQ